MKKIFFTILLAVGIITAASAQETTQQQPNWWFGAAAGANYNLYGGTTQQLNDNVIAPTAFNEGDGLGLFAAALVEYHFTDSKWGIMLQSGYDSRKGSFDQVMTPCDCPADLDADISYITVEPSVRFAPFNSGFYLYGGPRLAFNLDKEFTYKQGTNPDFPEQIAPEDQEGEFSETNTTLLSMQVGMGYDIPLSAKENRNQFVLAPFVSFQPYFGQNPRDIESWNLTTIRAGIALKFGRSSNNETKTSDAEPVQNEVDFAVTVPPVVPAKRKFNETFPLRNYVFFNEGSSEVPSRYVALSKNEAANFEESQLQDVEIQNVSRRSERQLTAYYNILNILGDRMSKTPNSKVLLIGSSAGDGSALGKSYAESIETYLVDVFGIDSSRIETEGRNMPIIPSEQTGGTKELTLLQEGDRRVDIVSTNPDLLIPMNIKAIVVDPIDSRIVFEAAPTEGAPIKNWSLLVTDENGNEQSYGPFTRSKESISGNDILGANDKGNYNVVMTAQAEDGSIVTKETNMSLTKTELAKEEALRFSVLFDFDKSKSVNAYETFLKDVVVPLVSDNSTVIIHGHSDTIGEDAYNKTLSEQRAKDTETILRRLLSSKKNIKYEVFGFGSDETAAPFENKHPEERFYNRTVIIDVIPRK